MRNLYKNVLVIAFITLAITNTYGQSIKPQRISLHTSFNTFVYDYAHVYNPTVGVGIEYETKKGYTFGLNTATFQPKESEFYFYDENIRDPDTDKQGVLRTLQFSNYSVTNLYVGYVFSAQATPKLNISPGINLIYSMVNNKMTWVEEGTESINEYMPMCIGLKCRVGYNINDKFDVFLNPNGYSMLLTPTIDNYYNPQSENEIVSSTRFVFSIEAGVGYYFNK